jgi:hypothetical protein
VVRDVRLDQIVPKAIIKVIKAVPQQSLGLRQASEPVGMLILFIFKIVQSKFCYLISANSLYNLRDHTVGT